MGHSSALMPVCKDCYTVLTKNAIIKNWQLCFSITFQAIEGINKQFLTNYRVATHSGNSGKLREFSS